MKFVFRTESHPKDVYCECASIPKGTKENDEIQDTLDAYLLDEGYLTRSIFSLDSVELF